MAKKLSRIKRHLHFMGIDKSVEMDSESREEREEIDSIKPLPLHLPEKQTFTVPNWFYPALVGFAALLLIMIPSIKEPREPDILLKGMTSVTPVVMRNGRIVTFEEAQAKAGDRVNFEIIAQEESYAYLAVQSSSGDDLLSKNEILASELKLDQGKKQSFSFSITLSKENDGEVATVYICDESKLNLRATDHGQVFNLCRSFSFILRKKVTER